MAFSTLDPEAGSLTAALAKARLRCGTPACLPPPAAAINPQVAK
ncbi:hypothetical protein [Bosea sp. (in: a-proteobacteria)]|nr:hypothetical protein [Bosea sp. (in: a-proteobacteria)]